MSPADFRNALRQDIDTFCNGVNASMYYKLGFPGPPRVQLTKSGWVVVFGPFKDGKDALRLAYGKAMDAWGEML